MSVSRQLLRYTDVPGLFFCYLDPQHCISTAAPSVRFGDLTGRSIDAK
jgi:hypothetical protein